MTANERAALYRQRKRAKAEAARAAEAGVSLAAARIVAGMETKPGAPPPLVLPPVRTLPPIIVPAPEAPPVPDPPPPLPADPAARVSALMAEMEATCRQIMLAPDVPAASRVAAMRSLGELHGILRQRAPASDPERRADLSNADPAALAAAAAEARADVARLESLAAALVGAAQQQQDGMPWE
jgi:hypothetical protein